MEPPSLGCLGCRSLQGCVKVVGEVWDEIHEASIEAWAPARHGLFYRSKLCSLWTYIAW